MRAVPDFAAYHVLLGHALGQAGLTDQAARQFREAIKRDPRYKPAREGLVWADARRKPGR